MRDLKNYQNLNYRNLNRHNPILIAIFTIYGTTLTTALIVNYPKEMLDMINSPWYYIYEMIDMDNWDIHESKPDPFEPERYAVWATAWAKHNREISGLFGLDLFCSSDDPDKLHLFFLSNNTIFVNDKNDEDSITAPIELLFQGGSPHTIHVKFRLGSGHWTLSKSDQTWLEDELQSSNLFYVRWEKDEWNYVTAEINVTGSKEAFTEIRQKCANPPNWVKKQSH